MIFRLRHGKTGQKLRVSRPLVSRRSPRLQKLKIVRVHWQKHELKRLLRKTSPSTSRLRHGKQIRILMCLFFWCCNALRGSIAPKLFECTSSSTSWNVAFGETSPHVSCLRRGEQTRILKSVFLCALSAACTAQNGVGLLATAQAEPINTILRILF